MDAEHDKYLPESTEDRRCEPRQECVQCVVSGSKTVCQQSGNRTDDNDGQRNHDYCTQERSTDSLEGIGKHVFDFLFDPAEYSHQQDRRDNCRCIGNRSQRDEEEFQGSSLADRSGNACPGGIRQSQAAPQCYIGVALKMPGSCHRDKDRQEGERRPGNHVIDLICTGCRDIDEQSDNDQKTLQKTGSCQNINERGNTAGHHGDDTVEQALFYFRSILRECHHT